MFDIADIIVAIPQIIEKTPQRLNLIKVRHINTAASLFGDLEFIYVVFIGSVSAFACCFNIESHSSVIVSDKEVSRHNHPV